MAGWSTGRPGVISRSWISDQHGVRAAYIRVETSTTKVGARATSSAFETCVRYRSNSGSGRLPGDTAQIVPIVRTSLSNESDSRQTVSISRDRVSCSWCNVGR